ncbi:hypothetical protein [Elizabethkingia miricola]|uniref:hypothetical protein n=1 Tax=Elizabethkingia miricola TaxID=172045 RepID=UPI0011857446|nr:hypothetical protein [Elizabethkingia miricola]
MKEKLAIAAETVVREIMYVVLVHVKKQLKWSIYLNAQKIIKKRMLEHPFLLHKYYQTIFLPPYKPNKNQVFQVK